MRANGNRRLEETIRESERTHVTAMRTQRNQIDVLQDKLNKQETKLVEGSEHRVPTEGSMAILSKKPNEKHNIIIVRELNLRKSLYQGSQAIAEPEHVGIRIEQE
jgi:hypothetical protein